MSEISQRSAANAELNKSKSVLDYVDFTTTFPLSHATLFTGQLLILLKLLGDLQPVSWKYILVVWVAGLLMTLIRAAGKKNAAAAAPTYLTTSQTIALINSAFESKSQDQVDSTTE